MVLTVSVILCVLFCGSTIAQVVLARRFVKLYEPLRQQQDLTELLPRVLVLLSLRGADPFLKNCLIGLLRQDYPNFDIRIIVDSRSDAAWNVTQQTVQELAAENVTICELEPPLGTCGLRVNALLQQIQDLDPQYDVVAWLDADTIPYATWLRDMVAPFADPQVGATTGIRWYVPAYSNMGTLIRSAWNAGAAVQMAAFGMAFGGSLAYRADLLRRTDVQDIWSHILWEDIRTRETVENLGYRLEFVGAATLATRERISLAGCLRFMTRQMLNVRLYHKSWPLIATHSVWMVVAPILSMALLITGIMTHQPATAIVAAVGTAVHLFGILYSVLRCGYRVRRTVTERGESPWVAPWGMIPAAIVTPLIYASSVVAASFARQVTWRGISYKWSTASDIRLVEYRPYSQTAFPNGSAQSL